MIPNGKVGHPPEGISGNELGAHLPLKCVVALAPAPKPRAVMLGSGRLQ